MTTFLFVLGFTLLIVGILGMCMPDSPNNFYAVATVFVFLFNVVLIKYSPTKQDAVDIREIYKETKTTDNDTIKTHDIVWK